MGALKQKPTPHRILEISKIWLGRLSGTFLSFIINKRAITVFDRMTTRTFGVRADEHAGVSFNTGVPLTRPPHSAVREHLESCPTSYDINNFKILASAAQESDPRILESLYIAKLKPSLNSQPSSYPLAVAHS